MKLTLFALVVLLLAATTASSGELAERQILKDQAKALFFTENFAKLNELTTKYRNSEERTPSGLWKLTLIYSGLRSVARTGIADEEYWEALEDRALRWVARYPNSPAAHLTYAEILTDHGWMYRGNGAAYEVRQEDWQPFYAYYKKAKDYLIEHKAVVAEDPLWYELMLKIAKAEGWTKEEFMALVEEATASSPYYYQIYFAAIDYLLPKWHGSREEIENFAEWATSITAEKEKNAMYARIYWYASQIDYGIELFTNSDVVWPKMADSFDDVLERYPDQWNINNFAFFSCLARDKETANQLIEMIDGKPIVRAWIRLANYGKCRDWLEREKVYPQQVMPPEFSERRKPKSHIAPIGDK